MKAVILDTETTGLMKPAAAGIENQPRVIEVGAYLVDADSVLETIQFLINPGIPLEPIITKITGLTDDDLADKLPFEDICIDLKRFWKDADFLIAHNAPFDTGVLRYEYERADIPPEFPSEIICTVQEYVPAYGYRVKLEKLYEDIMGKKYEQTHRALDDVRLLHEALHKADFLKDIMA